MLKKAAILAVLGLFLTIPLCAQRGALTLSRNISELVAQSDRIVKGRVVLARVERHPEHRSLHTVVVTLRVEETLKGKASETLTFRQFIWDIRDRYDAAGYQKGQHVLLLLNNPTRYGLVSTAGLYQGRFLIVRNRAGNNVAQNGFGNSGLFRDIESALTDRGIHLDPGSLKNLQRHRSGPVGLSLLETLIRQLAGHPVQ